MLDFSSSNASAHAAGGTLSKAIRAITTLLLVLLICSMGVMCPGCSAGSAQAEATEDQSAAPSVTCIERLGLSGTISQVVAERLTEGGPEVVFLVTGDGLYAVSKGELQWWQPGVRSLALIDDITGDGARDTVVSRGSSICAHSGVTGEKVWESIPRQRVFERDLGWSDWGFRAWHLQIVRTVESQIVAVTSGRYLFGVSSRDGDLLWEFEGPDTLTSIAAVADQNDDGADELVVGTDTGFVYLIRGGTGKSEWRKRVGEEWIGEHGQLRHGSIGGIASFDGQGSAVVVATGDGRICLMDLQRGDIEWENRLVYREAHDSVRMWLLPDVTGDGVPEILADTGVAARGEPDPVDAGQGITSTARGWPPVGDTSATMPIQSLGSGGGQQLTPRGAALLSGASGEQVWTTQLYFAYYSGPEVAYLDGQPVLLEPHPQLGIRMVRLQDGSVMKSLKVATLDGKTPQARQLAGGGYLVFSNGSDLAVASADGSVQWSYPRVSNTLVKRGQFTSDAIPDLLVCGESAQPAYQATATRLISVVDGATHRAIWRYEVPWVDFSTAGGLSSVQVAGDLTGDGIQDVLAYRGSAVFRFSGADGSLVRFDVDTDVVSLELVKVGTNANALLVGTGDGPVILDRDGNRLWESAYTDWSGAEVGAVRALNDVNRDNTSDLAILFADRILVARSAGASPLGFETHHSILAGDNKTIELKELTNDIDGDGVQEIAYFEHEKDKSADTGVLVVASPVSGKVWHQWDMPATVDLACADFNGDHYLDSLVHRQGEKPQYSMQDPRYWETYPEAKLEVYSGQDSTVLWSAAFDGDWWQPGEQKMPASAVGDVTGDGVNDLAVSSVVGAGARHSRSGHDTHVSVYDIVNNSLVKEVILPPVQKDSYVKWEETTYDLQYISGPGDVMRLAGDLNGDGHHELAVRASYRPIDDHDLALVDLQTGQVLGYSTLFDTLDFFETNENYTLGFAAGGSVYLVRVNGGLRVARPSNGTIAGSRVRIAWEGTVDSSSASVFVDGYENARTRGSEAILTMKPGEHEVMVRSVDEYGVVTYAAVHFKVAQRPWMSILAGLSVAVLLSLYFSARCARVLCNRRAQRAES